MAFLDFKNLPADQIVGSEYVSDSAWHVHKALCWCDYSVRNSAPQALHYSAYHLRTGIEHLWFDILFASQGGNMSIAEYERALERTTTLYKLVDDRSPHYEKFAEFVQMMASIDTKPHPPMIVWDIGRLKRLHGECGGKLLHFQGVPERGYLEPAWITDRTRFLSDSATWIFDLMKDRGNLVVYFPDGLKKPEVYSLWERFRDGAIDAEAVRVGLRIVQPIVRLRPN